MDKNYWDNRYASNRDSGYGSYGEQLEKKLNWLSTIKDDVKSITEVGCGDFNFGKHLLEIFDATYVGLDISEVIVNKNKVLFPQYIFNTYPTNIPSADMVMCVDVLFHITDDSELEKMLYNLNKAWTKYLVITAYERDEMMSNHVRIRKFDYTKFGKPLIREIVEEDGNLYFYIFKK